MSDSGGYGPTRVAAGIVGYADLTLGERVEAVLEAQIRAGGGRFRGVRHSGNWDADPVIGNGAPGPDVYRRADFRAGLARLTALGLSLDAWVFHTQLADVIDLARAFPGTNIIMGHVGGVLGYGPYAGRRDEVFASWKASVTELAKCPNVTMKLGGMMMRAALVRLQGGGAADHLGGAGRGVAALYGDLHRAVRAATAACSKAISRWRRWGSGGLRCGTRSSGSPPARQPTRSSRCSMTRRDGSIG